MKLQSMVAGLRAGGLGLSEMSRMAKVSRTTLWRVEVGESTKVSAGTFERIAAVYRDRQVVRR